MSESEKNNQTSENNSSKRFIDKASELTHTYAISGMYKSWFMNYASYVILERAVPHISDGLKPVQRRILYTMSQMDDRLIKVANIVGFSMQLHPHGDASIADALVQLGQKDLLIDCQGNWGNILTGDGAAAARYIEARLTPFAKEILFSPKITEYKPSYDGANKEPIRLPVKFPLLLAQGVEGIAVGLSSKVLPHNVKEILEACISHLKGKSFQLFPDFQTGGLIDVSRYNDGERGGNVKIRANIIKKDSKTLVIDQLPYGKTTSSLIDSILRANERGKIRIKKVDDKTAEKAQIEIILAPGTSSDKTIDALYAFTDCEISLSPNFCVIKDDEPIFTSVSAVLKDNVESTKQHLSSELHFALSELKQKFLSAYLEQLFIEERIYKDKAFEEAKDTQEVLKHIKKRLSPHLEDFEQKISDDDYKRLLEIRMARILRFNKEKNEILLKDLQKEMEKTEYNITHIVEYTISWFTHLLKTYGKKYPRKTEIRSFDTIEVAKVVEKNEKLYVNRSEGFIGTMLKKDEFVANVSDIDDIIVFLKSGKYFVIKVTDKAFVGKNIIHVARFIRNDKRTIYNAIYRDGKKGTSYIKRFNVTSITRDREYDISMGKEGSTLLYFSANPNGEAETVKVVLKPNAKQKHLMFEKDFSEILIKGRGSKGNIVTHADVHKIVLKEKGLSTLGGRKVWFDKDVNRLNYDERGLFLGEFFPEDRVLIIRKNGEVYTSNFLETNHYEQDILKIEKFDAFKIWTLVYYDSEQNYTYIKRFQIDDNAKSENMLGDEENDLILLTDHRKQIYKVSFGGPDEHRMPIEIDAEDFIAIKSMKAKGKRVSNYTVEQIEEISFEEFEEENIDGDENAAKGFSEEEKNKDDFIKNNKLLEEASGQKGLFSSEKESSEDTTLPKTNK